MRRADWQSRMAEVMREARSRPFAWGEHDCVTFAAACVKAVTGVDRIADVRTAWADERQAIRLLVSGGGLLQMVQERLGPRLPSVLLAKPGDVGVCMQGARPALCVCGGVNWHMPARDGLATLSFEQVLGAWSCEGS